MSAMSAMSATSAMAAMPAIVASDRMHVIARVGGERFAFRVADVEEVLDAPALMPVPGAPPGLSGQLRHRGRTVSAYDSRWSFGIERRASTRSTRTDRGAGTALILRVAADRVALLVDDVEDLTALDSDALRAAPAGTDPSGLLRGVFLPREGGNTHVLVGVVNVVAVVARASSLRVEAESAE